MKSYYLFLWLAFIISFFLMWFFTHRANHKERLLMIEKGVDPETVSKKKPQFFFSWVKLAAIVVGLGLGLLIIASLVALQKLESGGGALPMGILVICGGIGMLAGNYLKSGKSKE